MHKPTARHRTITKHDAGLHTVMPTLRHNGRQDGLPARMREYKQSRGQEHRIGINRLYAKNDSRIVLFVNGFRKGGSIFNQYFRSVTRPFPKLVCKGSTIALES